MGARSIVRKTSVLDLDDEDGVKSGSPAAARRRPSRATADFEAGYKTASAAPKEAAVDPEEPGTKDVLRSRDLGLVANCGQFEELSDFMHGM